MRSLTVQMCNLKDVLSKSLGTWCPELQLDCLGMKTNKRRSSHARTHTHTQREYVHIYAKSSIFCDPFSVSKWNHRSHMFQTTWICKYTMQCLVQKTPTHWFYKVLSAQFSKLFILMFMVCSFSAYICTWWIMCIMKCS